MYNTVYKVFRVTLPSCARSLILTLKVDQFISLAPNMARILKWALWGTLYEATIVHFGVDLIDTKYGCYVATFLPCCWTAVVDFFIA